MHPVIGFNWAKQVKSLRNFNGLRCCVFGMKAAWHNTYADFNICKTRFKDETVMKGFGLVFICMMNFSLLASLHFEKNCQDVVTGVVSHIKDLDEVDHMMAKVLVTLDVDGDEMINFKYPKYAMIEVLQGEEYRVGLRDNKVCYVEGI